MNQDINIPTIETDDVLFEEQSGSQTEHAFKKDPRQPDHLSGYIPRDHHIMNWYDYIVKVGMMW
ncbi:hypothetical protein SNE26_24455 [Mucilaginibacter sp. cycad4]|uniref:hypothetical protein n=1 Tax=Mucilaginibacter sp. cycad4 TaxID=3342096 RepID=UPI002AAB95B6|nr:hypothetical protein [Mucilaginibacter gossypii]WPU99169.1 hypothetical protein SNE26_24455 [Mucilaginibacter gossypii]